MTKTVKVRILVAVDHQGNWVAHGHTWCEGDKAMEEIILDDLGFDIAYRWITAEVPIPEATDIVGVVE